MAGLHQPVAIFGEILQVLRRRPRRIAFKAGQAMTDIRRVTDLAHFAVARDIDAGGGLARHGVVDGPRHHALELPRVDGVSAILGE